MTFGSNRRVKSMLMAACAVVAIVPASAHAQAGGSQPSYNIPAQDLGTALTELARQSHREIFFSADLTRGKRAPRLSGRMSFEQALSRLLAGAPLRYRVNASGSIVVEAAAQVGNGSGTGDDTGGDEQRGTSEILVTGTRSQNVDIKRSEDDAQPYVVLGRDEIAKSNATNVEDFLRTRLPMNATASSHSQAPSSSNTGSNSRIDLRGLGAGQTLILIDGRRPAPFNEGVGFGQPDLNGLALASIERIEILPSTASGIYGGGATGGVINIITRRDFEGVEFNARYGSSFRADARSYDLSMVGGFNLNEGKTRINFSAGQSHSDPLYAGDRDFSRDGRAGLLRNSPSTITGAFPPFIGYTPNIASLTGANLVLDNGTSLNSPVTFVPIGYPGAASDGGAALVANAGRQNLDLAAGQYGAGLNLLPDTRRSSVTLGVKQEVSQSLEFFADLAWNENHTRTRGGIPSTSFAILPGDAPNNPFDDYVLVSFGLPDVKTEYDTNTTSMSLTGGFIYHPSSKWAISADHAWARSTFDTANTSPIFSSAFDTALGDGSFDVIRDLNRRDQSYDAFLLPSPNDVTRGAGRTQNETTFRVAGSVVHLPGGWLRTNGSVQYREIHSDASFRQSMTADGDVMTTYDPKRSQRVLSGYLETTVPLVSPEMKLPLVRELEVTGSVRYETNRTRFASQVAVPSASAALPSLPYGSVKFDRASYTLALSYKPVDGIQIRGSYGTGFAPPTLGNLGFPFRISSYAAVVTDPQRGGTPAFAGPFTFLVGGNPNLQPETSRSWSAGIIFTPRFAPNLRLSADYTNIHKSNEIIAGTNFNALLASEAEFPGRIVRDPLTATDRALGYTGGRITLIDGSALNNARSTVGAFDFQADYETSAGSGKLRFSAVATYQPERQVQRSPNGPLLETAGTIALGSKLKGSGTVEWQSGPLTIGWNLQYVGQYGVCDPSAPPASCADAVAAQGAKAVGSQFYNDLYATLKLPASVGGLTLSAGIQNLFDRRPPLEYAAAIDPRVGYSLYGDPRLRRFTIGVSKSF